jgi:hypothetical protein
MDVKECRFHWTYLVYIRVWPALVPVEVTKAQRMTGCIGRTGKGLDGRACGGQQSDEGVGHVPAPTPRGPRTSHQKNTKKGGEKRSQQSVRKSPLAPSGVRAALRHPAMTRVMPRWAARSLAVMTWQLSPRRKNTDWLFAYGGNCHVAPWRLRNNNHPEPGDIRSWPVQLTCVYFGHCSFGMQRVAEGLSL